MERHGKIQDKHDRNKINRFNIVYQWQRCLIMFSTPLCPQKSTYYTPLTVWYDAVRRLESHYWLLSWGQNSCQLDSCQVTKRKTAESWGFFPFWFGSRNVGVDHANHQATDPTQTAHGWCDSSCMVVAQISRKSVKAVKDIEASTIINATGWWSLQLQGATEYLEHLLTYLGGFFWMA